MPTKNPRVNLTFEPEIVNLLTSIADGEKKSVAGITKELVIEALERREDKYLSTLAKKRDKPKAKKIAHEDVW